MTNISNIEEKKYMTPNKILSNYKQYLTNYELKEISFYKNIYFFGKKCKTKKGNYFNRANNYGFDNSKHRYRFVIGDHIIYRYKIIKKLGYGSFGDVATVYDFKDKCKLAIKMIRNESRFHRQGNIEIKILKQITENDPNDKHHLIHMNEHFLFRNHLCITFELLDINLYTKLRNNQFKGFPIETVKIYAIQILNAFKWLKEQNIIHCDLKPENIVLKSGDSNDIKIIDFGSACLNSEQIHSYIQSRFYRAPEIVLKNKYSFPIDMWSIGCILIEFNTGKPIFPGRNEHELLVYIIEVIGLPPFSILTDSYKKTYYYNNYSNKHLRDSKGRLRHPETRPINRVVNSNNMSLINLITQCLEWDPIKRITPSKALELEWLN